MAATESGTDRARGDRLSAIRLVYEQRLQLQSDEMRRALEQVDAHRADHEALEQVRRIAHRLHGSAGSFGFDEVSEAAALLEAAAEGGQPDLVAAAGHRLLDLMARPA